LRNTLDRRRSPSYRRERGHHWSYDHRLTHHDREHTLSQSPAKRRQSISPSPRKSLQNKRRDIKKHPDATEPHLSDVSGPIDGAEDVAVDEANDKAGSRSISTNSQEVLEEQVCSSLMRPCFLQLYGYDTANNQLCILSDPDQAKASLPVFYLHL
jgi:hypothetical protein